MRSVLPQLCSLEHEKQRGIQKSTLQIAFLDLGTSTLIKENRIVFFNWKKRLPDYIKIL